MPAVEETDPDETHWRETYDRFRELKLQLGEPADRLSFEKFAAKLKKNRTDLLAKHNCKGVRFSGLRKRRPRRHQGLSDPLTPPRAELGAEVRRDTVPSSQQLGFPK